MSLPREGPHGALEIVHWSIVAHLLKGSAEDRSCQPMKCAKISGLTDLQNIIVLEQIPLVLSLGVFSARVNPYLDRRRHGEVDSVNLVKRGLCGRACIQRVQLRVPIFSPSQLHAIAIPRPNHKPAAGRHTHACTLIIVTDLILQDAAAKIKCVCRLGWW
jgi:hypothetical protein